MAEKDAAPKEQKQKKPQGDAKGGKKKGHVDPKSVPSPEFWDARVKKFEALYEEQCKQYEAKKKPVKIKLLSGDIKEGFSWVTTPFDIAKGISSQLPDKMFCAKVNDELWDMGRVFEDSDEPISLEFLDWESAEARKMFWHSSAHILGAAMEWRYGAKLSSGPPLDDGGFFYEAETADPISADDLGDLNSLMKDVIKNKYPFQRLVLSKEDALDLFGYNTFKHATLSDKVKDGGMCTAYRCGPLIDPCRGPHVHHTGRVKAMVASKNSSSYWRGKDTNPVLQRVYGMSFPQEKLLKEWEEVMKEAAKNDHRRLGVEQGLWMFNDVSPGSCFWYPPGAHIYNKLTEWMRKQYRKKGFEEVISPNMYSQKLWQTSGHWQKYSEDMFHVKSNDKVGYSLKPMNCPGHCVMFGEKRHSYKEFPIKYADFGVLHRNELAGALSGLTRVRRFCQDDAHIFCLPEQTTHEIEQGLQFLKETYDVLGFKFHLALSTRPVPEKRLGTDSMWDVSEKYLRDALNKFCNINPTMDDPLTKGQTFEYDGSEGAVKRLKVIMAAADKAGTPHGVKQLWFINEGDGAFYGPKIDIRIEDAMMRKHQLGTLQLDFNLPQRFDLTYEPAVPPQMDPLPEDQLVLPNGTFFVPTKENPEQDITGFKKSDCLTGELAKKAYVNSFKRPVMIHRAILGSLERCIAILAEHWKGKWPFWVSPRQIIVVPVTDANLQYAKEVKDFFHAEGYAVRVDMTDATLNKKIRNGQLEQNNFILVVGQDEMTNRTVNVRSRDNKQHGTKSLDDTLAWFNSLVQSQDSSM